MRDFIRRLYRGIAIGVGVFIGVAVVPVLAGAPTGFTFFTNNASPSGGGGSFPADFPDLNNLLATLNNEMGNWLTLGNAGETGEIALSNGAAFAANGSVATAMSSVGPVGSHTTIQKWLIVIDNNGSVFYGPLF